MSGQERVSLIKDNGSWLNCCVAHGQFSHNKNLVLSNELIKVELPP